MPLAFTQEDFLVIIIITIINLPPGGPCAATDLNSVIASGD